VLVAGPSDTEKVSGAGIQRRCDVRKKNKSFLAGLVSIAIVAASNLTATAANVDVYAEGAYTDTKLDVYIYADMNAAPLVSAGVQLTYDNTKLTLVSAVKNQTDWYFGTPAVPYAYQDPRDTGSAVVFISGKLDTNTPGAGVTGSRKLIGTASFTRTESAAPGTSPETYFGSALGLGIIRTAPDVFANFVTNGGEVLDTATDGVSFEVMIRERGDANGNGEITSADMGAIQYYITHAGGIFHPWMDCNGNGQITGADKGCVQYLITH